LVSLPLQAGACGGFSKKKNMTLSELYKKCAAIDDMPEVAIDEPLQFSNQTIGKVVSIYKAGIHVKFSDLDVPVWFWNLEGGKKNLMNQLKLL